MKLALEAQVKGDAENSELAKKRAVRIENNYLSYEDEIDGKTITQMRIVLSKADRDFYADMLKGKEPHPQRESHKRLRGASSEINKLIERVAKPDLPIAEAMQQLKHLTESAADDCHVIHLVSEDKGEAYKLFEVLNDRGRSLTEGDLLRSSTLERLEGSQILQEKAEKLWDAILTGKTNHIEKFLRAYYASRKGDRPDKHNLFDNFNSAFFPSNLSSEGVLDEITRLSEEMALFTMLTERDWPYESLEVSKWDENRLTLLMEVLKHDLALPLLLSAVKLPQKSFAVITQTLERFVFRYIIVSHRHAGKLEQVYLSQCVEIREDPVAYDVDLLLGALNKLQNEEAPEDVFKPLLMQEMMYKPKGGNKQLKYFLATLEQFLPWQKNGANGQPKCTDKSSVFDFGQLSIEHIYPQSAGTKVAELEIMKHDLGNLSFWAPGDNSSAGNQGFAKKKELYLKSKVSLNNELTSYQEWTPKAVAERRVLLADRAVDIFKVK